jgi:hypothetical protein
MLSELGLPVLRWLRRDVVPEARRQIDRFDHYLARWEHLLYEELYRTWPA